MSTRGVSIAVVGAVLASAILTRGALAYVSSVDVLPANPRPGERVKVDVRGDFPDPCWTLLGKNVVSAGGGEPIKVEILAEWRGGVCPDVLSPYALAVNLGRFQAGTYEVVVQDPQDSKKVSFTVAGPPSICVPGDSNGDASVDISDAVFTLLHLFSGGPEPGCARQADANSDDEVNVTDAIYLLQHLFQGGERVRGWTGCYRSEHCVLGVWEIFCSGHWECDCGECKAVCELEACGDGYCDLEGGESVASCPGDCKEARCRPVCASIGTRSEGWYDSCTGKLIGYAFCGECDSVCLHCGSKSEGWYDSCTGELIEWASCQCMD
jgi:hypothetical protein